MNSQFFLEKLQTSQEFKEFKEKYIDCYLCSAFFVIDLENKIPENKYHFDFYVPSNKKTFSFELENEIKLIELEMRDEKVLEEISLDFSFDFDEIKELILNEMVKNNINNKIQKLIFSLQRQAGKDILLGTIFLSGLALLRANISISDKKIIEFEKKSFLDMMKIMKK